MDIQDIKDLMEKMCQTGISFLEIDSEGTRLRLKRASWSKSEPAGTPQAAAEHPHAASAETAGPCAAETPGRVVTSPTVGIFYSAASPDSDAFVSVGSAVETGAPLCIIEAMKLMNEVTSPCDGVILEIYAENGQRVEFGQPLMRIGGN